jgi:FixJ family two-component response regulator
MPTPFSVHVLSQNTALRREIHHCLDQCGYAYDDYLVPSEAISDSQSRFTSCILADIDSLGKDPIEFLESFGRHIGSSKIIFLVNHAPMALAVRALRTGAIDLLDIPIDLRLLSRAIEHARAVAMKDVRFARLSPREKEILHFLMEGLQNKSIAIRLGISHRTVDIHRSRLMEKLSVHTFADLCYASIGYIYPHMRALPLLLMWAGAGDSTQPGRVTESQTLHSVGSRIPPMNGVNLLG